MKYSSSNGFTLIEVLVATAVIGILASVMTLNFLETRALARDKVRINDLKEMQIALELYKAQNGRYPEAGCGVSAASWAGSESDYAGHSTITPCVGNYIVGLVPTYLSNLPDEVHSDARGKGYVYRVAADGSAYKLLSHHNVEVQLVTGYQDEFARFPLVSCVSPFPQGDLDVYAVYSKGAECW
jgi:prepilin-type N-terminal cleavage/methylation domain-containing protein